MKNVFLVSTANVPSITRALQSLGAKAIQDNSWITPWSGTADSLCRHLKQSFAGRVVVCALSDDWSYR